MNVKHLGKEQGQALPSAQLHFFLLSCHTNPELCVEGHWPFSPTREKPPVLWAMMEL